jgi:hypothetical protein
MGIIGFDFSINKPAACIYSNNNYSFYSWPFGLSENLKNIFREAGVHLIDRDDEKYKGTDSSEKMRWEVSNSIYLSDLIISGLPEIDLANTQIVFEGLSFASSGNVVLQLSGYKYILMKSLYDKGVSFPHMATYAPITLKKTAGCSKKGMGKKEMIDAFIESKEDIPFRNYLELNKSLFQKKTGTWIDHLDDLVDSYFCVKTFLEKNSF